MDAYALYTSIFWLHLLQYIPALKHDKIVLSKNLSGSFHHLLVDGATVMSQEFYKDKGLSQKLILQPTMPSYRLMIQFIYLDIEKAQPCRDYLQICESSSSHMSPGFNCIMPMVPKMCGDMKEIFPKKRKHHLITSQAGRNLLLEWNTHAPSGKHRGFRITVTAISGDGLGDCRGTRWKCSDDMCISSDLHCDKVPHCLDVSDETVNCSNSGRLPSVYKCDSGGGAFPCVGRKWHERWFNVAIPMLIVLVLFLVAFILKIRNMICRPAESQVMVGSPHVGFWRVRPPRRYRPGSSPGGSLSSQLNRRGSDTPHNLYDDILCRGHPEVDTGGRQVAYDPVGMVLLPPPYSAALCPDQQYHPPTEGEPPPVYEEFDDTPAPRERQLRNLCEENDKNTTSRINPNV